MTPNYIPGGCFFKNNFGVIEAFRSSTSLVQSVFYGLYIYFEHAKRFRNE